MDKKKLIVIFLVSFYIICSVFNMYYLTDRFQIFYYGKHVSLLLFSLFVFIKKFKDLKVLFYKVPKEIHLFSIIFLLKTIVNLFRLQEAKMGIYIIQDLSIILFFYAILFTVNKEIFNFVQKYTFRITSILLLVTFLISWINGVSMFEVWARSRFIFGFDHPGYLGSLMAVAVISSLSLVLKKGKKNYFDLTLLLIMVIFLILNYSRNAIVVVIVYSVLLLILKKYDKINLKLIYITLISIVVITFLVSFFFFDFINKVSSLRLSIWFKFIKDTLFSHGNIWFGHGIWMQKDKGILSRMHVDNYNLEFIYESGIILYALFFISLNFIFIYLSRINNPYIKYSLASFVGIVFYGFFDSSFLTFGSLISVYLWFNILGGIGIHTKFYEGDTK
jgi:hypothetical protein